MAEQVDAYGSGPYDDIYHAGSSPVIRTKNFLLRFVRRLTTNENDTNGKVKVGLLRLELRTP